MGDFYLQSDGALGLGRRIFGTARRIGFCGRSGNSHFERSERTDDLYFAWQASRLRKKRFGFNAGSALGANELAANAFIVTQIAAATGVLGWVLPEWIRSGKPTILGAVSGGIAGLVAITPAAGYVTILPSLIIGAVGGVICYCSVAILKEKFGYDDSLDAFGVHGVGGMWGAVATGIWATTAINPDGADGLFYGDTNLFFAQIISIVVAIIFAVVGSTVLYKIVNSIIPLRVDETEEILGLDVAEHGENGYNAGLFTGAPSFISGKEFETANAFDLNHHSI